MPVYVCLPFLKLLHESESVSQLLSRVRLFATPWTASLQAPLSMGFSRQEYWSGLPCPPPGDRPDPGIEPGSAASQADSLPSEPPGKPELFLLPSPLPPQIPTGLLDWGNYMPLNTPQVIAKSLFMTVLPSLMDFL